VNSNFAVRIEDCAVRIEEVQERHVCEAGSEQIEKVNAAGEFGLVNLDFEVRVCRRFEGKAIDEGICGAKSEEILTGEFGWLNS